MALHVVLLTLGTLFLLDPIFDEVGPLIPFPA